MQVDELPRFMKFLIRLAEVIKDESDVESDTFTFSWHVKVLQERTQDSNGLMCLECKIVDQHEDLERRYHVFAAGMFRSKSMVKIHMLDGNDEESQDFVLVSSNPTAVYGVLRELLYNE